MLDFLKNSNTTEENNNTTAINNTLLNETHPTAIATSADTTRGPSDIDPVQFLVIAVFEDTINKSIISIYTLGNNTEIQVDSITLFTSYDNINFTEVETYTNITPLTAFTIPVNTTYQELYYYLEILYNNTTHRIPGSGAKVLNITT